MPALDIDLRDHLTEGWLTTWLAINASAADPAVESALLRRVDRPTGYASARLAGEVVAVGRAVADTGWAGIFGMATLPRARGRGIARHLLTALAGWAADHDATHLYRQVERDNTPARTVYTRAGITELCWYHYRTL